MVAAEHPLEAMAGLDALKAGGNAMDAALAAFYMTAVVEQHQAGLGGDCFVLAYIAKEHRVVFFNGTGPAPKLATLDRYRKLGEIPVTGPYAVSVPGAVGRLRSGMEAIWQPRLTRLCCKPAIEAAARGHVMSEWSASNYVEALPVLLKYPASVRALLPGSQPPHAGDLFLQTDLAHTLETLARGGADSFYRGTLAHLTADSYQKAGGLLRYEDLSGFRAEQAEPVHTNYKGYDIYASRAQLTGSGAAAGSEYPGGPRPEVDGLQFASLPARPDRGDEAGVCRSRPVHCRSPIHTDVPLAGLLSREYAAARRTLIRRIAPFAGWLRREILGMDARCCRAHGPCTRKSGRTFGAKLPAHTGQGETSSFSIADRFGNLVSVTHSVNGTFGSGIVVDGGGFVLNNRLPCFYLDDGNVNLLAPGKRTRHTISPALALKDGKPFLAWNTPGGDNQPQAMLQAFLNVVEFGMNVQQAVEAPTMTSTSFHESVYPHPIAGTLIMPKVLADQVGAALAAKGHRVVVTPLQKPYGQQPSGAGAVKMVRIDPRTGIFAAGVSPAKDDYAIGW